MPKFLPALILETTLMKSNIRLILRATLIVALCGYGMSGCGLIHTANAVEVQWNFDNAALAPDFNDATTSMEYRNGATTSGAVAFGTASGFGLPAMPGGNAAAMRFPAFGPTQGLGLYDLGPNNGGGSDINQFTMAWDILFPDSNAWQSLLQTAATNVNDGDFFVRPSGSGGGIGTIGSYDGTIANNTWYRVVAVFDTTVPSVSKYIDGVLVGTTVLNDGVDARWSLYPDGSSNNNPDADSFILTDNDGDTNAGYISMFYYTDRAVDAATVASWGGADADGVKNVAEPSTAVLAILGLAGALAGRRGWRSRRR
jgi:hypothetical protein